VCDLRFEGWQYVHTVRGDTCKPSLSKSSSANLLLAPRWVVTAMRRMSARRSVGSGGRPGVDFHRQHMVEPLADATGVKVAGCTMTKACRQSNQRGINGKARRVAC